MAKLEGLFSKKKKYRGTFVLCKKRYGVFVRFSTRGVQKHHKTPPGKVHVKNLLLKS
jgi:hypothetical protein